MTLANLKIGTRLGLAFGVVITLLVIVVAVAMMRMSEAEARMTNMLDDRFAKISLATQVKYNVARIHQYMRAAVLAEDAAAVQRANEDMNALRATNKELLNKLDKVINIPKARAQFEQITAARAVDLAHQKVLVKLMGEGKAEEARAMLGKEIAAAEASYVKQLGEFGAFQEERMADEAAQAKAGFAQARVIMLSVTALALLTALAVAILVSGSITGPLKRAVGLAQRVAAGDLTVQIEVQSVDETGQLLGALREMNESLAQIVGQVRTGTDTMVTASVQIAAGNLDLSARTERQASALEQTASSMEELTGTVQQNAANARQGNTMAQSASVVAQQGKATMAEVVATMNAINESSHKIVDIIGVIDGIAFQTNILALNAAVEAARAGEQGRGFAVVASEVRNLAQRSAAAAKEIKALIGSSVEQVQAGAVLVRQAGGTMDEVVKGVAQVSEIIGQITHASVEQTNGIEQVNTAIIEIDDVTQQNAALVEQAAAAAQSLRDQAEGLSQLVGVFKLNSARVLGKPAQRPLLGAA